MGRAHKHAMKRYLKIVPETLLVEMANGENLLSVYCINAGCWLEKKTELHLVAVKNHAIDISDFFPSYSTVYVKVFLAPVKTIWNNETGTWSGLKTTSKTEQC